MNRSVTLFKCDECGDTAEVHPTCMQPLIDQNGLPLGWTRVQIGFLNKDICSKHRLRYEIVDAEQMPKARESKWRN